MRRRACASIFAGIMGSRPRLTTKRLSGRCIGMFSAMKRAIDKAGKGKIPVACCSDNIDMMLRKIAKAIGKA